MRERLLAKPSERVVLDIVMSIDVSAIVLAAVLAEWIYIFSYLNLDGKSSTYALVGVVGAIITVVAMRREGIYQLSTLANVRGQMSRILFGLVVAFVVMVGMGYVFKISASFSRGWIAIWFALSGLFLFGNHYLMSRVLRRWSEFGLFAQNIAIYGSGEIAVNLMNLFGDKFRNYRVVGVYDDLAPGEKPKVLISGGLSDLIGDGQSARFDEVLIAVPLSDNVRITNLVTQLSVLPTSIKLCPDMAAFFLRPVGLVHHDGVAFLELVQAPMSNWAPVLKMAEDWILSVIVLLLVSPIMVLVALAVKLDSRGPVFFRQRRHGFNHQVISVLKFRTMSVVEDGTQVPQARRDDPRITSVGKILRRTSLDELPQLINVLRGEMSLVGPRPHALAHNEHYSALLETYASRHKVKPGITGWAQVNGLRGETDTPEKMRKRVEYDLYYIENWSIWFDIKILLMTPIFGLLGKNAF